MSVTFKILDYNYLFQDNVNLSASTEDASFPVSNLNHFFRSKIWRTTATTAILDIDLRTEEEIDAFAMFFDPIVENNLSSNATFRLQASATQVWTSTPVDETLSFDENNETITHYFATAQSYRFWRLTVTDTANPDGYLNIPKIYLGKSITLTSVPQIGFAFSLIDQSKKTQTPFGHEYVDVYPIKKRITFNMVHLDNSESEELWKSFYRAGTVNPILISIDSTEQLFDKYRFTFYAKYDTEFTFNHVVRDRFNQSLSIEETF